MRSDVACSVFYAQKDDLDCSFSFLFLDYTWQCGTLLVGLKEPYSVPRIRYALAIGKISVLPTTLLLRPR